MNDMTEIEEMFSAGESASIENIHSESLFISLLCGNDCRVDFELAPGQVLEFAAGSSEAKLVLHHGDPANLLIIKPESAS